MLARLATALLLVTLLCPVALADELTPAKATDIKLLLSASGGAMIGKQLGTTMTRQLIEMLRRTRPDIPVRALAAIEREVIGVIIERIDTPGGLLDRMVPLYSDVFTHQEIREMLAFYQSPVGKKAVQSFPALYQAGQKLGEDYAKELGPVLKTRIDAALAKEGVTLEKQP